MPRSPLTFIPQIYQPNSNMAELILRQGNQQAQSQRELYGGIGQAISGLGQGAADLIGQRQEQKKVEQQKAEMSKRDAAWVSYVESGEWSKDPAEAYKVTTRIWGPTKEAEEHFKGLQGAAQLIQPKRDQKADAQSLGAIIGAIDATPEGPGRARLYQAAVPLAKAAFPELQVEDQYNPETWAEKSALGKQLRGEKPAEPPKALSLDAQLAAAVPGSPEYAAILQKKRDEATATRAPREAPLPILEHVITDQGIQTFDKRTGKLGPVIGQPKANAAAPPGKLTKDERQEFDAIDYTLPKMNAFMEYVEKNPDKYGKWDAFIQEAKQAIPGLADEDYSNKQAFVGRMEAEIRHALFGSAVSEGEKKYAESFTLNAGDQPARILGKIKEARDRMEHKVSYYEGLGYKVGGKKADLGGWQEVDGAKVRVKK